MGSDNAGAGGAAPLAVEPCPASCCLQSFELYETKSKFYMLGCDSTKTCWRVLKIDRSEPSELNLSEDTATYTYNECVELLKTINEGNRSTGGLKFVTNCYGIIGFIKFLGPYYMLLITERKRIGAIFGHSVYQVTRSEMIVLTSLNTPSDTTNFESENRYRKLFGALDLTTDFFFSYSYHITRSLQKNLFDTLEGHALYDTMFVWNEFLTQGIRKKLNNTVWTVALIYGFFKQDRLMLPGKNFVLTLIARRSRHYAGTRYLKRGVNDRGRVANDVETEQIIFEDVPSREVPTQFSSVVQNRGSIPLFWSQETSVLNLKPDIILHERDSNFEATKLHFENLRKRYGNPIIILNLIKKHEKKPRESLLRSKFDEAIKILNQDLSEEDYLRFLHWDLHLISQSKATTALTILLQVASQALDLTGFFHCHVTPVLLAELALQLPIQLRVSDDDGNSSSNTDYLDTVDGDGSPQEDVSTSTAEHCDPCSAKPQKFQKGVLRTNCIDCLDRTNVAQYAYGLAALGHQLHAIGYSDAPIVDLDSPLAHPLMQFYEQMGDTLARQYGGSAAHNKIFSARRGHLKFAIQSQEFLRTLQRHYNNSCMDTQKQAAINLFLGYFQPQDGRAALWELDAYQNCDLQDQVLSLAHETSRFSVKKIKSEDNILQGPPLPPFSTVSSDTRRYTASTASHVRRGTDSEIDYCYDSAESNFIDLKYIIPRDMSTDKHHRRCSTLAYHPEPDTSTNRIEETTCRKVRSSSDFSSCHPQSSQPQFSEIFTRWIDHGDAFSF